MADSSELPSPPRLRPPGVVLREIGQAIARGRVALAILAGIGLRLICHHSRIKFWMDERAVMANISELRPIEMFGPLRSSQLAPPGFLVAEWVSGRVFGIDEFGMRLVPFLGGVASLFLFLAVARRMLGPESVFAAVLMFAVSSDLVYYSTEVKQYSTDVTACLACLLLALTIGGRGLTIAGSFGLAAFGALVVWYSHPSIFMLASVGIVGLIRAIRAKDGRSIGLWLAIGIAWLASFAGVHAVATRQLAGSDQMWRFWDFAFPPRRIGTVRDLLWPVRRLAYFFINPLNFDAPFGPALSMIPALGLALLGLVRIGKGDPSRLALLVLPVAATMTAAILRLYPFHGRLVLFLAPIPLIAIAAGLEAVREARGRGVGVRLLYVALVVMVLVVPSTFAIIQASESRWSHNYLGDLHPDNLDPDRFPF